MEYRKSTKRVIIMRSIVNGEGAATFSKSPAEVCLNSIYELQQQIESAPYGTNRAAVMEAITKQEARAQKVTELGHEVKDVCEENQSTSEERERVEAAYSKLQEVSEKKVNCLHTMLQIASMQSLCTDLSRQLDIKAVDMTDTGPKDLEKSGENIPGFLAPSSQDCIFAAKDNWNWIVTMVKCIDIHLKNASAYQQFFHEVEEGSVWLHEDLRRLYQSFTVTPIDGNYSDGQRLLEQLQDIVTSLRQWETRTNFLWERALKVVPVQCRTTAAIQETPARCLVDYSTSSFKVREDEDLLLLDNSDSQLWKVRTASGEEVMIPALAVLIPGPFKDAVDAAIRMRLQLIAAWTNAIKVIGKRLILFMLMVFKPDYEEDEIDAMKSIQMMDRQDLMRILDYIEDTLKCHWGEHEGFQNLQERILMLRMILEDAAENPIQDENTYKALIVQITTLEKLMNKYQEMWRGWEKYKTALEASQAPELMLIVDKWEQLKFVSREQFAKYWQNELPFDEDEKRMLGLEELKISGALESYEEGISFDRLESADSMDGMSEEGLEELVVKTSALNTAMAMNGTGMIRARALSDELETFDEGLFEEGVVDSTYGFEEVKAEELEQQSSEFGYAKETKTAKTEQLSSAEVEESKRFVIRSVFDPRTDEDIALNEAVSAGIINTVEGKYINLKTLETMPIPVAMSAGLIKVSFSTTKRGKEKKSSIGIITVKTERLPIRPYVISTVRDTLKEENIDQDTAVSRGIINKQLTVYKNLRTRQEHLIGDAAELGLAEIEYTAPAPEPEVIRRTYAVRAVVDRGRRKIITFQQAVTRGIIDKDSGAYKDTANGTTMYVGDAIMRGFLKARVIDNTHRLDVDPRNKMVIDATEKIRRKIVRPLAVINALRQRSTSKS